MAGLALSGLEGVPPGASRVVAIANQKGGVGKTTTAVNLGAALAELGRDVLVVDLDPQGNASTSLGVGHGHRARSVYDVITGRLPAMEAVANTGIPRLRLMPSTVDLAGAEIELVGQFARESLLKQSLQPLRAAGDVILLDCPPSLGLLTVNALTAADEVIVPIQCEYFALEGLGQLLRNLRLVQQNVNPNLRLNGIVLTMYDPRTKLSEQVVAEVRSYFGEHVYRAVVPRSVRASEAPGFGMPVITYDASSRAAVAYRDLAHEFISRPIGGGLPADFATDPRATGAQAARTPEEAAPPAAPPAAPAMGPNGSGQAGGAEDLPEPDASRNARLSPDADADRRADGATDAGPEQAHDPSPEERHEPGAADATDAAADLADAGGPAPAVAARRGRWPFRKSKGGDS